MECRPTLWPCIGLKQSSQQKYLINQKYTNLKLENGWDSNSSTTPSPPWSKAIKVFKILFIQKYEKIETKQQYILAIFLMKKTNQLTGRVPMQHNKEIEDGAIISAKRTLPYCKHAAMSNGKIQWGETSNCFVYTDKHVVKRFFAPLRGSHLSPR